MRLFRLFAIVAAVMFVPACEKDPDENKDPGEQTEPVEEPAVLDLGEYTIVYSADAEAEEGIEIAELVRSVLNERLGKELPVVTDKGTAGEKEILIGKTNREASAAFYSSKHDVFAYKLFVSGKKLVLAGGGCWAMRKAAALLKATKIDEKFSKEKNIYGDFLFEREEGATIRILDDNIWQYDNTSNAAAWVPTGEDCTNQVRSRKFAALVLAYMPDVFCMQEYSSAMHQYLLPLLNQKGYQIAYNATVSQWNFTPIYYNPANVSIVDGPEYVRYDSQWSNGGTKSYLAVVFKDNKTGKLFAVMNTHLWWKSESSQAGSNAAREDQVRLMMEKAGKIIEKHKCPVFAIGDMNCNLNSNAMKLFTAAGYKPACQIATVYGDPRNGHHTCSSDGFSRASSKSDVNGTGAIDQFMCYNMGEAKVLTFWRIEPYFTVPLTDHYPNYADIKL